MKNLNLAVLAAAVAAASLTGTSAHAQILLSGGNGASYTPLTTGDSSDFGYTLSGVTTTVAGVGFTGTLPSGDTLTSTKPLKGSAIGAPSTGVGNLDAIVGTSAWIDSGSGNPSAAITLTLTGLTSGVTYQLDSLLSPTSFFGPQTVIASVVQNGVTLSAFNYVDHNSSGIELTEDLRTSFVSDGTDVTATFQTDFGDAYVNGFSLTSAAAVPEPSTYALLGLGGAALFLFVVRGAKKGTGVI